MWDPFGYTPRVQVKEDVLDSYSPSNPEVAKTQSNVAIARQREELIADQQVKLEDSRKRADNLSKLAAQNATYAGAAETAQAEYRQQQERARNLATNVNMDRTVTDVPTNVFDAQENLGKKAELQLRMKQPVPKKTDAASYQEIAKIEADRAKATAEYNALTEKERKGTQRVEDIQKATASNKRRKALFDAALQTWKDNGQKGRRPKLADFK